MTTVRITDLDGVSLAFDLRELLDVLGDNGVKATWRCQVSDFVPASGARHLPTAYEAATNIVGAILYQIAAQTLQIIDGRFVAMREGEAEPWVILTAVDSTWWEVTTNDPAVLKAIAGRFRAVVDVTRGTA